MATDTNPAANLTQTQATEMVHEVMSDGDRYSGPTCSEDCGTLIWSGRIRLNGQWHEYEIMDHSPELEVF